MLVRQRSPSISTCIGSTHTVPGSPMNSHDENDPATPPPTTPPTTRLRDLPRAQAATLHPRPAPQGIWNRPDRPFVVGVLGWVCAAIGYVSFFLKGSQLPSYFIDMKWLNPAWKPMPLTRYQFLANITLLLAEMALALLAIAGGLGCLKLREWARRTLFWYAIAGIALGLLKFIYQMSTFDQQIDFRISTTSEAVDRNLLANREFFYLATTTLMTSLIWPLLVLAILTRRHVRKAFDQANGVPGTTPLGTGDEWRSN